MNSLTVIAIIGAALSIGACALLFARLRRLPEATSGKSDDTVRISIIIPCRNEAENLDRLLPSLKAQKLPPFEVLVVDDQSEDGTAETAKRNGAVVVSGRDLPGDWLGKPWACHQGAEAAKGEWLLFADADLEFEVEALDRLAGVAAANPESVISVCPWHRVLAPYEQLSVFFNLIMVGGIGAFTWKGGDADNIGLFGQTLFARRDTYFRFGGYEAIRDALVDNFQLSRICEKSGIRKLCFIGKGSISMRMFPGGYRHLVESWTKGFSTAAGMTATLPLVLTSVWLTGLMIMGIGILFLPLYPPETRWWFVAIYALVAFALIPLFRQIGKFTFANALLFPISLFFYQAVFARAVWLKKRKVATKWKGRDVH